MTNTPRPYEHPLLYHTHARDYFNQTVQVDPAPFLLPLVKYLTPGSKILDVGCGSGRDMLWLKQRGFDCTGLERSPELVALARQHSGLPVSFNLFLSLALSCSCFLHRT